MRDEENREAARAWAKRNLARARKLNKMARERWRWPEQRMKAEEDAAALIDEAAQMLAYANS